MSSDFLLTGSVRYFLQVLGWSHDIRRHQHASCGLVQSALESQDFNLGMPVLTGHYSFCCLHGSVTVNQCLPKQHRFCLPKACFQSMPYRRTANTSETAFQFTFWHGVLFSDLKFCLMVACPHSGWRWYTYNSYLYVYMHTDHLPEIHINLKGNQSPMTVHMASRLVAHSTRLHE